MSNAAAVTFAGVSLATALVLHLRRSGRTPLPEPMPAARPTHSRQGSSDSTAIKEQMELYSDADRVFAELRELGIGPDDALDVALLCKYDQYHYLGTDALDNFIQHCGVSRTSSVLDVGSGIGGPARYVAHKAGCKVMAVELQGDLNSIATVLTQRCGLEDRVTHVEGNILEVDVDKAHMRDRFDHLVSILVFLHITDRRTLFSQCRAVLKPGANMYIEDFVQLAPLTPQDRKLLKDHVFCTVCPTQAEYTKHLEDAGFTNVKVIDMTQAWTDFVVARHEAWVESRERQERVHSPAVWRQLNTFYSAMRRLFTGGNLGGVRIVATNGPKSA